MGQERGGAGRAEYYAHSANGQGRWEPLRDHLKRVAALASSFAKPYGMAEQAELAGELHDLGKACELFQKRLAGEATGLNPL